MNPFTFIKPYFTTTRSRVLYYKYKANGFKLRGGRVQGKFFWKIRFKLWAPQVPLIRSEGKLLVKFWDLGAQLSPSYAPPKNWA